MISINILDFLKTGQFGLIKLGMNIDEVIKILGQPENRLDSPDAILISYGYWEIHFLCNNNNKVFLIQNDNLLYDCTNHDELIEFKNDHFTINLEFLKPFEYIRLEKIIDILKANNIEYQLNHNKPYHLELANGINLGFTDNEPIIPKKDGFHWKHNNNNIETHIKEQKDYILTSIRIWN